MDEQAWMAERFEEHRSRLRAVAYRMLGSTGEADDAVQEAWLRFSRSGADGVENLNGWLTTVTARGAAGEATGHALGYARGAGPDRGPRGQHRPRAGGAPGRLREPRAARGPRNPDPRREACVRFARHVRDTLRRDRPHRGPFPGRHAAAREPRSSPGAWGNRGPRRRSRPPAGGRGRLPRRRA